MITKKYQDKLDILEECQFTANKLFKITRDLLGIFNRELAEVESLIASRPDTHESISWKACLINLKIVAVQVKEIIPKLEENRKAIAKKNQQLRRRVAGESLLMVKSMTDLGFNQSFNDIFNIFNSQVSYCTTRDLQLTKSFETVSILKAAMAVPAKLAEEQES